MRTPIAERLKRLCEGRCPLHNLPMTAVGTVEGTVLVVECVKRCCPARGYCPDGGKIQHVHLLPEFADMIDD